MKQLLKTLRLYTGSSLNKKMQNIFASNMGITLIALVITIIILLILAGITLNMVMGNNGIFEKANNASEQTKIANAKEIIKTAVLENELYKNTNDAKVKSDTELLTPVKEKLIQEGYTINEDNTITIGNTTINIPEEIANASTGGTITLPEDPIAGKNDNTKNRNLAGKTEGYSYKNPVIPQGFKAIDVGEAIWSYKDSEKTEVTGWNDGLVIQDDIGNQFVWVPVDGTKVKYEKWCTIGVSYLNYSDDSSAIPITENEQIAKYQGFYVARYEAGLNTVTLKQDANTNNNANMVAVSKENTKIWNYIDYSNAKTVANAMINSEIYGNTKSGLITGTQWDTIMRWYSNSNIRVNEAQDFGTYHNIEYNGNGLYFINRTSGPDGEWKNGRFSHTTTDVTYFHASGLNLNGIKKNIADLGGNMWELTSEVYNSTNCMVRGGRAGLSSKNYPSSCRNSVLTSFKDYYLGFRTVLYIK